MNSNSNCYLPEPAKIIDIKEEVSGQRAIKTFRTQFLNGNPFSYRSGQCAMLSVFGKGESMISISSGREISIIRNSVLVATKA